MNHSRAVTLLFSAFLTLDGGGCSRKNEVPAKSADASPPTTAAAEFTGQTATSPSATTPASGTTQSGTSAPVGTLAPSSDAVGASFLDQAKREAADLNMAIAQEPKPARRVSLADAKVHATLAAQARAVLLELQQLEQDFRRNRDRIRPKAERLFNEGKRLANDPLARDWRAIDAYAGLDREKMGVLKDGLERLEGLALSGEDYDPEEAKVAIDVRAWAEEAGDKLDELLDGTEDMFLQFRCLPVFYARSDDEVDALQREGWFHRISSDYLEVENAWPDASNEWRTQDQWAALRERVGRHTYAMTYRLVPHWRLQIPQSSRPEYQAFRYMLLDPLQRTGDQAGFRSRDPSFMQAIRPMEPLVPVPTRWTWCVTDVFAACASFEYWYAWATDERWYKGSSLRLDPERYPHDAPESRALWKDFKEIVLQGLYCPLGNPRPEFDPKMNPFSNYEKEHRWTLFSLRRLSRNPDEYAEAFQRERRVKEGNYPSYDSLATYFVTPTEARALKAEPAPLPSNEALVEIRAAEQDLARK
ncbi:MAG: hypothetical protein HOP29_11375 [Phycisphaerales bacterium]|nr:hypothetical protein [Phycisphaerales bacterium]